MDIIVIYCTVPDKQIAKDITNILLKHKLAACVSMIDKVADQSSRGMGKFVKKKKF